jgi:hypothetical protein
MPTFAKAVILPGNKRRDTLARTPIGELAGWHLLALCGTCRQERIVSINSLVERYGQTPTLYQIVPRLRCAAVRCRQPPIVVKLRNRFPVQPGPPLVEILLVDRRAAAR